MFHVTEDGSAIVSDVSVAPFLAVQHMQVNVTSINHLANYALRMAQERGWLRTPEDLRATTESYQGNDARPLLAAEGFAHKGSDQTFFYAGVEATVAALLPHFRYPPTPSTLMLSSRFHVSHVGSSSYAVYGELSSYIEGREVETTQPLGTFRVTTVQVSRSLRSPMPLPAARRALLVQCFEAGRAHLASRTAAAGLGRLNARDILAASGVVADPRGDLGKIEIVPYAATATQPMLTRFRQLYTLRESDFDFNHHLNQLAMQVLVLNAFRASLKQPEEEEGDGDGEGRRQDGPAASIYPQLLNSGVHTTIGDLLLRNLRIDYVREIPSAHAAAEVFIFPLDATAEEKMRRSRDGARLGELSEIGFFACGVPKIQPHGSQQPRERYLAAVGVLSCYV